MILRQIVDLAFDASKIAPQPKEANDQKERSTVLRQQQGMGEDVSYAPVLAIIWEAYGKQAVFQSQDVFPPYGAVRIVSLAESCEKSRANRVAASRIRR